MQRILVLISAMALFAIFAQAQQNDTAGTLPRLIRYSGAVSIEESPSASNATVGVVFALYKDQQGGAALWTEIQNVKLDANGNYSVLLGSQHPDGVPAELFTTNEARWLGVQVEGQPEQGRVLLVSVPYAYKAGDAETLGGFPPSAFVANPTYSSTTSSAAGPVFSSVQTSTIQPYTVTSSTGTAGQLGKWIDSTTLGNSLVSDNGSYVGISQTAPGAVLDVNGLLHIGSHTLQTTGLEAFVLGQNSRIGGSGDGNALEFRITHDIAAGSPNTGLLFQFRQNDNSGANLWGYSMRQFKTAGEDSTYLTFGTNPSAGQSVERIRIDKNGKVGIGTASPAANLEVVTGLSEVRVSNAVSSGGILQLRGNSDGSSDIQMNAYSGTPALRFRNSSGTALATLTATGNLGIGVDAPGQKLSVAGVIESTSGGFKYPDGTVQLSANSSGTSSNATTLEGFHASDFVKVAGNQTVNGDLTVSGNIILGNKKMILGGFTAPSGGGTAAQGANPSVTPATTTSPFGFNITDDAGNAVITVDTSGSYGSAVLHATQKVYKPSCGDGCFYLDQPAAVRGDATGIPTGQAAIGVLGSSDVAAIVGLSTAGYGMYAQTEGTSYKQSGISAWATATTGDAYGVYGGAKGDAGVGGFFYAASKTGQTFGVVGEAASSSGFGGRFKADSSTGSSTALLAESLSDAGTAGRFEAQLGTSSYILRGRSCDWTVTPVPCTTRFAVYSDGDTIIGSSSNHSDLTVYGWVNFLYSYQMSSVRYKKNIRTLDHALDKVRQLRGVSYDMKDDGRHQIGVIAEEVGKVVPEIVAYEENGTDAKGVDYSRITALLIEAVKEQQARIDELEKQLKEMKATSASTNPVAVAAIH